MKTLLLKRISDRQDGTFGVLFKDDGTPWLLTVERPWVNNQHDISCIPPGTYTCQKILSPKRHYNVFQVMHVPDRDMIEIHIANTYQDVLGCIGVGKFFGDLGGLTAVMDSGTAFLEFMEYFSVEDSFSLRIINATLQEVR